MVPEDLCRLRLVGSPTLLGDEVVAVVETVQSGESGYRSRLAAFPFLDRDTPPAEPRWLTASGPWMDTAPIVSPTGQIAFLSTRTGRRQVHLLAGDSAEPLVGIDAPVAAASWYDATTLIARVDRADPDTANGSPIEIDWLRYKSDGRASFREPTSELWLLGIDGSSRLLHRAAGRMTELAVVDGHVVTIVEERHSDELEPVTEVRRIALDSPPDDPGDTLWSIRAPVTALLATAKSGRLIAVSSGVSGQSVAVPRLWLIDALAGTRPLAVDHDVDCERAIFSDSRPVGAATLLRAVAGTDDVLHLDLVGDDQVVFRTDIVTGASTRISPPGQSVSDFSAASHDRLALCLESATCPTELFATDADAQTLPKQLSMLNSLQGEAIGPEPIEVAAPDGLMIKGLLYRTRGSNPESPQMLIRVHGGPHGAYGNAFDLETQIELAAGFNVLAPNLRGSAGRDQSFRAGSVGEWGRADYSDLAAVSDWAVDSGICRPESLHLAGGSYGGYLINWALTRTDRYRSAVSERSISNLLSKWGTSDNGFSTNRFEFGGLDVMDETAEELLERSPIRHANRINTPVLLLHGEADARCPIEQSEQLFVALRRQGKECKLVRFPGAFHPFASSGRPDHRIRRLELIVEWLSRHAYGSDANVPASATRVACEPDSSRPTIRSVP